MLINLNITLDSERALLRPLGLHHDIESHKVASGQHTKVLDEYIWNTVFYSISRSERDLIKLGYFKNLKAVL